jgi:hypothetical protein
MGSGLSIKVLRIYFKFISFLEIGCNPFPQNAFEINFKEMRETFWNAPKLTQYFRSASLKSSFSKIKLQGKWVNVKINFIVDALISW